MDIKVKLGTMGSRNKKLRAFTNGGTVFIDEHHLDILAKRHPQDYLRILEKVVRLIGNATTFTGITDADGNRIVFLGELELYFDAVLMGSIFKAKFIKIPEGWGLIEVTERSQISL